MVDFSQVRAWNPGVRGIDEVFHAFFSDHAYPQHTHEAWTLLIVDSGAITYDLERREHGSVPDQVTLLPPRVPHDGRAANRAGFQKRVLYLSAESLDGVGAAVDAPGLRDPLLRTRIHQLHRAVDGPGDELEAESRLALVLERLQAHLHRRTTIGPAYRDVQLAATLRDLLDARFVEGVALHEAGMILGAGPAHLVRSFSREYGIAPHQYLLGRRIDRARKLLLTGDRPGEVAVAAGFHDQSHFTRHFKKVVGTTPARYASTASGRG